jgi:PPOX class probable FMN-dependent enzyme
VEEYTITIPKAARPRATRITMRDSSSLVLIDREFRPTAPNSSQTHLSKRPRASQKVACVVMSAYERFEIRSVEDLRAVVGEPLERVIRKETATLDERATAFIGSSPFVVVATANAAGDSDASPRGGPPGFVRVLSDRRLVLPEFPGNRRLDGVANMLEQPGVGLLFVVPGISETLRVNGVAHLTRDPELAALCEVDGRRPWFVVDVAVRRVFSHCGKAFLRSELWSPGSWPDPEAVVSPSLTIAERSRDEGLPETTVRQELEESYRPILY